MAKYIPTVWPSNTNTSGTPQFTNTDWPGVTRIFEPDQNSPPDTIRRFIEIQQARIRDLENEVAALRTLLANRSHSLESLIAKIKAKLVNLG